MICSDFERWLDDGCPAEGRAAAEAHAGSCQACAQQLAAMGVLEELLSSRFAAAPAAFADRVMAGLPPRAARTPAVVDPEPDLPWWVRLFQEPLTAGSFVAAAGLLAALPQLPRLVEFWTPHVRRVAEHGVQGLGALQGVEPAPLLVPGLAVLMIAAAPLLVRAAAAVAGDPSPDADL